MDRVKRPSCPLKTIIKIIIYNNKDKVDTLVGTMKGISFFRSVFSHTHFFDMVIFFLGQPLKMGVQVVHPVFCSPGADNMWTGCF